MRTNTIETQNTLRIKVLKCLGHSLCDCGCERWIKDGDKDNPIHETNFPDYSSDLNACAEFEKTLDADQCVKYVRSLDRLHETSTLTKRWAEIVEGNEDELYYEAFALVTATAEQRCLAFIAVIEQS